MRPVGGGILIVFGIEVGEKGLILLILHLLLVPQPDWLHLIELLPQPLSFHHLWFHFLTLGLVAGRRYLLVLLFFSTHSCSGGGSRGLSTLSKGGTVVFLLFHLLHPEIDREIHKSR